MANRARGAGDFYKPDAYYNGIDWTTDVLLEQIKRYKKPLVVTGGLTLTRV
ncbi:hypothetical protein ACOBV9_19260 (plasmid) [Pseudoalteromonas espejiana]